MFVYRAAVATLAVLFLGISAASPVSAPVQAAQIPEGKSRVPGRVVLRVSLLMEEPDAQTAVGPNAVVACTRKTCFRTVISPAHIGSLPNGDAVKLAEISIPPGTIESVRFESVGGDGTVGGELVLPRPFEIPDGFYGGEVFVSVRQSGGTFVPVGAASGLINEESNVIHYNPKSALTRQLPLGVKLTLPAGATESLQFFHVAVHDTGGDFPMVDIYPVVTLLKAGSVSMSKLLSKVGPRSLPRIKSVPGPYPELAPAIKETAPGQREIPIKRTGVINPSGRMISQFESERPESERLRVDAQGWSDCASKLNNSVNKQAIAEEIRVNGYIYLDWCTEIPPYVHIGIAALSDSREAFSIKWGAEKLVKDAYRLPLTRMTEWHGGTNLMLNGFTWVGDEGTSAGQYGLAKGYLTYNSYVLGENRTTGGAANKFPKGGAGTADNPKWVSYKTSNSSKNYYWEQSQPVGAYNYFALSSSTSVVRNGACSTDNTESRWSVFGLSSYMPPRVIFISSTSKETTAAELCPVVKALDGYNALRLDGGPSAVMSAGGVIINQLSGLYYAKYGALRYIPYALKIAAPGK